MTIDKEPKISKQLENYYKAVMKRGGPTGIFTQAIVDEYESAMKEENLKLTILLSTILHQQLKYAL